jgi:hypothetical protein
MLTKFRWQSLCDHLAYGNWFRLTIQSETLSQDTLVVDPVALRPNPDGEYEYLRAIPVDESTGEAIGPEQDFPIRKIEAVTAIEPLPLKRRCGTVRIDSSTQTKSAHKVRT